MTGELWGGVTGASREPTTSAAPAASNQPDGATAVERAVGAKRSSLIRRKFLSLASPLDWTRGAATKRIRNVTACPRGGECLAGPEGPTWLGCELQRRPLMHPTAPDPPPNPVALKFYSPSRVIKVAERKVAPRKRCGCRRRGTRTTSGCGTMEQWNSGTAGRERSPTPSVRHRMERAGRGRAETGCRPRC